MIYTKPRRPNSSGFTLVELMIVVLIISILSAVAVPGYRNHVVKTQRAAAKACLLQYAQLLERFYTTNLTYVDGDDLDPPGCASEGRMADNYTFEATGVNATEFQVNANRTTAFAARDTTCGNLTLDQRGVRGVSSGTLTDCWN